MRRFFSKTVGQTIKLAFAHSSSSVMNITPLSEPGICPRLARRFLVCELDARCESPETRRFPGGFLDSINEKRLELVSALLTIWRFGAQNSAYINEGRPLGSFERWAAWCRDPLLTLGCRDPVERVETLKTRDPHRQRVAELFVTWWTHHGSRPTALSGLANSVRWSADPHGKGRQYLAHMVGSLVGTNAAGFVMRRVESPAKWSPAEYLLERVMPSDPVPHRGHRDDQGSGCSGRANLGADIQHAPPVSPDPMTL